MALSPGREENNDDLVQGLKTGTDAFRVSFHPLWQNLKKRK